jgi:hypothetical protein
MISHADEESRAQHEGMGFKAGRGQALAQLVEHVEKTSF